MNTVDFIRDINSDNISSIVVRFFDELMVLYNLIGDRQDLDICTDDSASVATFTILMESEADAVKLHETLHNSEFEVYSDKFNISMSLSGSTVNTIISKK